MQKKPKKKQPSQERRTAYHEAGQAVIAFIKQVEIDYVTIEPSTHYGSPTSGECVPQKSEKEVHFGSQENARAAILILLAGKEAARLITSDLPEPSPWTLVDDESNADLCAGFILGGNERGQSRAEDYARSKAINTFLEWQRLRVARMVKAKPTRAAIVALAKELLKRKRMSGEEVREIIAPLLQS